VENVNKFHVWKVVLVKCNTKTLECSLWSRKLIEIRVARDGLRFASAGRNVIPKLWILCVLVHNGGWGTNWDHI